MLPPLLCCCFLLVLPQAAIPRKSQIMSPVWTSVHLHPHLGKSDMEGGCLVSPQAALGLMIGRLPITSNPFSVTVPNKGNWLFRRFLLPCYASWRCWERYHYIGWNAFHKPSTLTRSWHRHGQFSLLLTAFVRKAFGLKCHELCPSR